MMTIQEAIEKAREGGYTIDPFHDPPRHIQAQYLLETSFWEALGRALGWDHAMTTVRAVENGRPTIVTRAGHHWLSHWHHFIDDLAEGKTAESFFESLSSPVPDPSLVV